MDKISRTAREIKVSKDLINNKNLFVKIGTSENRDSPQTIYAEISFWLEIKEKKINGSILRKKLEKYLEDIYKKELPKVLVDNFYFPNPKDNIFIINIPENVNYNGKRNFVSLEIYLHTVNINSPTKFPLNNKKNTELFKEILKVVNIIGNSDVLNDKFEFLITQKTKKHHEKN